MFKKNLIYIILLFSLVLRLISINQSFWLDEATTATVAGQSLLHYLTKFAPGDFHPPLYYILVNVWASFFGNSELSIRSISLFAGMGTIWFVYKTVKRITSKGYMAEISALFLATSGLHVYYSQEARMYSLAALFVSMAVYYFYNESWKMFSLSLATMVLTHYVTVFMLPVFFIYGLITNKKRDWWRKYVISHSVLAIGFFLWSLIFVDQLTGGLGVAESTPLWWNILGKTTPKEMLLVPAKFFFGRITIDSNLVYGGLVGIVGLLYGLIIVVRRPLKVGPLKVVQDDSSLLIWLWFFVPFLLTAVFGLFVPVFSYFRLLFILPAFYLLLAFGISSMTKKFRVSAIVFILVVNLVSSGVYLFNPRFHRENWKGLVEEVNNGIRNELKQTETVVLFVSDSQMEGYGYYQRKINEKQGPTGLKSVAPISPNQLDGQYQTLFLMRYVQPIFDPEDLVRQDVEKLGYEKISEHDFNGIVVWKYEK